MIALENPLSKVSLDVLPKHAGMPTAGLDDNTPSKFALKPTLSSVLVFPLDKARITRNDEERLLEPFRYYRTINPGKGRRQTLLKEFNHHLSLPQKWIDSLGSIVEDLHNSSLLIDDIEDNSPLRRGFPTAHVTYGVAPTINSGNYVYFLALNSVAKLADNFGADRETMMSIFVEEMLEVHRGQGMEIWFRQNHVLPTLEEYMVIVERKTGALLRLSVRLLQCHPQCAKHVDLVSIAEDIGILYQVRDDYINLASISYTNAKGFAEDISEGKYSFPIMHSLTISPESGLAEILKQRPDSIHTKQQAIELIRKTDSLDFTVSFLQQLERRLCDKITRLGGNPGLERFASELSVDRVECAS